MDLMLEKITEPERLTDEPASPLPVADPPSGSFLGIDEIRQIAESQVEDWFIPNWLEFGSLAMLCGHPFSGKSTLVAEIVAAACKWGSFGLYDVPVSNVLLIDLENRESTIIRRLKRATEEDLDCLKEKVHKVSISERRLPLDAEEIERIIDDYKREVGIDRVVVVIDTFRSAFFESEMDVDQIKRLLYPLQRVAQRHQAAVLIVHHRPKSGAKYSGQTAIAGALDYLWVWESNEDTRRGVLSLAGTRGDRQEPMHFWLNDAGRNVWVDGIPVAAVETLAAVIVKVVGTNPGISQTELIRQVQDSMSGEERPPGQKKIIQAAERLEGLSLVNRGKPNSKRFHLIGE